MLDRSPDHEMPTTETTVIVVGAGPSGLATTACLTRYSIPYILVEREDCIASLWKKKAYDRLHLHLSKQHCQLPHSPMPSVLPKYVPRADFVRYLDNYALQFRISPIFNRTVTFARYDEGLERWRVKAVNSGVGGEEKEEEEYVGRFLVVASGVTCDAYVPEVEGIGGFVGKSIHSTEYKSGKEYEGKRVLVVGSGNSGMEIALDLSNFGAHTSIVVRSPAHIMTRWMLNFQLRMNKILPIHVVDTCMMMIEKVIYGDLSNYGLSMPKEGPYSLKSKYGKYPIVDVGTISLIRSGLIQVLPVVEKVRGNEVTFVNGKSYPFDAIIFATGFRRSTANWLMGDEDLLDEDGLPKRSFPDHWKGKRGLYCAGLARRALHGAGLDAQNIADDIKSLL